MFPHDPRTTLMIKNIPNKYTICFLAQEIDSHHHNTYDFLYLPYDMKVLSLQGRTIATSDTASSTLSAPRNLPASTTVSTAKCGTSFTAKRYPSH